jgi:hypothetical protein
VRGYPASFASLFDAGAEDAPRIERIEIPLIQRDYAQGRTDSATSEIRRAFLEVLRGALTGGDHVGLDFVYGEVENATLRPLDGQQRLTTLFLLHWYLASRTNRLNDGGGWKRFSYATRQSARLFCARLVTSALPPDAGRPSRWITDQPWFLYTWDNDPTISSMLTVIDEIDSRFATDDLDVAWARLTDGSQPAISFHLLPIEEMGSGEELYIKMNSRGKPLTPFENFKARFERTLAEADEQRAERFAHKIDGEWSDLLWPIHGGDNLIDDEFMRYLGFITEICEWREGRIQTGPLAPRTERVFGAENERAGDHFEFLCGCFDVWDDAGHVDATFQTLFAGPAKGDHGSQTTGQVVLFGENVRTNLFEACCRSFGRMSGANRVFGLGESLLLYAVLLHMIERSADFPRRLRVLRNLIAASEDEVRRQNMPKLLEDLRFVVLEGSLDEVATFNQVQVDDERLKGAFIAEHPAMTPAMNRLEDHSILRGSLQSFELDASTFDARAEAFDAVFSDPLNWRLATGALLACGDYQRRLKSNEAFQFGSGSTGQEGAWRRLLTGTSRRNLQSTREVLAELLDRVAASDELTSVCLSGISNGWLGDRADAKQLDWRYYMVKYDAMRDGESGIYYAPDGVPGYSLIMLRRRRLNSYYRDPYLYAIWLESGETEAVEDPWFYGYDPIYGEEPRSLRFERSGARMRLAESHIAIRVQPADPSTTQFVTSMLKREDVVQDAGELVITLNQVEREGGQVDNEDRIAKGAQLLKEMVAAGL